MTAAAVAGSTLAVPALVTAVEAVPAVTTLVGKAGAAASAGAGQAHVRGRNALARGAKAVKGMYEQNGANMVDGIKWVQDFMSAYVMPPSLPTNIPSIAGTGIGVYKHYETSVDKEINRARRAWDESKYSRESRTGEFIHK